MYGCDRPSRSRGDLEYPDDPGARASNGERFRVSGFGARFCSGYCEVKYEHLQSDCR